MEYKEEEYITVTQVLEYCFCPRFTYYENVANIPEHQEKRYKVLTGREVHKNIETTNTKYLRKKLGVINKEIAVPIYCSQLKLKGIIDEVLTLEDNTMAPLDYKYAEYKEHLFQTHRIQAILYGLLIEYFYKKTVQKAFICYTRSSYHIEKIDINEQDRHDAIKTLQNVFYIINYGFFPKKTRYKEACQDCCYQNICC